jgi:hypothetical protein
MERNGIATERNGMEIATEMEKMEPAEADYSLILCFFPFFFLLSNATFTSSISFSYSSYSNIHASAPGLLSLVPHRPGYGADGFIRRFHPPPFMPWTCLNKPLRTTWNPHMENHFRDPNVELPSNPHTKYLVVLFSFQIATNGS